MRYNDVRDKTTVVDEVLERYTTALSKKVMISNTELFKDWLVLKQDHTLAARSCGFTAWCVFYILDAALLRPSPGYIKYSYTYSSILGLGHS